jgi:hypothetical protein
MVIEILRELDPHLIENIRNATRLGAIKPIEHDVITSEADVREAFVMILDEASRPRV